jgi:hypothetical protein
VGKVQLFVRDRLPLADERAILRRSFCLRKNPTYSCRLERKLEAQFLLAQEWSVVFGESTTFVPPLYCFFLMNLRGQRRNVLKDREIGICLQLKMKYFSKKINSYFARL